MSDYNFASKLEEYTEVYEPITFDEIVTVMIIIVIVIVIGLS